jgi:diguanylate cyclase (GGDEF)-like protein/PAS domain S-box-containing protein
VDEVMTQSVDDSYAPESAALMHEYLHRLLEAANAGAHDAEFRGEFELRRKDGSTVWVETTITDLRDSEGNLAGVVGVTRDISERKRNEARMRELALHDALTGLPNRTLFSDRLRQALAAAQRERRRLAVMFIDLDKFKPINDEHGHAVGDELLKEVAKRMHACVRESDTVARIGGDEFVVLLRSVEGGPLAVGVGEKIRHSLNEPFEVLGLRLEISCCIGVALSPEHGVDEIELSKNADAAMYWAKAHGRDNVQLYRSEMARDI